MRKYDLVETIILEKSEIDSHFKNSLELKLTEKLEEKNKFILFNTMRKILIISLVLFLVVCGGYIGYGLLQEKNTPEPIESDNQEEETNNIGIANPASTNCVEKGGKVIIEEESNGQVGYCVFDDGSKCEEWSFYRGECKKGDMK